MGECSPAAVAILKRVGLAVIIVLCTPIFVVWWLGMAVAVATGHFVPYRDGWTFGINARSEVKP